MHVTVRGVRLWFDVDGSGLDPRGDRMCRRPHPKFDAGCEQLALRLWRATPGSMLAMATVHRRANGGAADPAHNPLSVFHECWAGVLGPRGIPHIQIDGFADTTAPEQVAVSTGTVPAHPAAERIAVDVEATGLRTTRSWDGTIDPNVAAVTNVQGIAAADHDWIWIHLEHNRTVRTDETLWHRAIDAVAAADPGLLARDRPAPDGPRFGPRPAGAAGDAGSSRYLARADHVHPLPGRARLVRVTTAPGEAADRTVVALDGSAGNNFRVEVSRDTALRPPTRGGAGQQISVLVRATRTVELVIDDAILLGEGITTPVLIPHGKHWLALLTDAGPPGWFLTAATLQR
jgi:hypothetical protein